MYLGQPDGVANIFVPQPQCFEILLLELLIQVPVEMKLASRDLK